MAFAKHHDRFVNLDFAATGKICETTRGVRAVRLFDERQRELGVVDEDRLDALDAEAVIGAPIPAVVIGPDGSTCWAPVIAWRIGPRGAEPVFHGARPAGVLFLSFTGGELLGMGRRFPNIDAAVEAVRAPVNDPQEDL